MGIRVVWVSCAEHHTAVAPRQYNIAGRLEIPLFAGLASRSPAPILWSVKVPRRCAANEILPKLLLKKLRTMTPHQARELAAQLMLEAHVITRMAECAEACDADAKSPCRACGLKRPELS